MDEFIDKEEYHYPYDLVLNVTDACNLKCKYCFVEQHPNFMTLDVAKKALEFGANNRRKHIEKFKDLPPERKSQITFFGGEPLLMFDKIIKPLVEFANQEYPDTFIYSITTNGTLLTHEIIDFLTNNKFSIMLSFDGFKEIQDNNRPCQDITKSSFDMVFENLAYLLYKDPNVVCRPTISKESVDQLFNIYLFIEACGFKNIEIYPDTYSYWEEKEILILKENIKEIFIYQTNQILNNTSTMNFLSYNKILKNILKENFLLEDIYKEDNALSSNKEIKQKWICGIGTYHCAIRYNGDIFTCQEQITKEKANIFNIGNIFNGIDYNKQNYLLQICNKCERTNPIIDDFFCLAESFNLFNSFTEYNPIGKIWYKELKDNLICMLEIINLKYPKKIEEIFLYYI